MLSVDEVDDQTLQLGRVLDAVLRLAKHDPEHPRVLTEFAQDVAVVDFQFISVEAKERPPIKTVWHDRRSVEWRSRLFVIHFQEEQICQLLDVIAV